MGYQYGSKKTALNGIYLWLQRTQRVKVTPNNQFSQNQALNQCTEIMKQFLISENIEIPKYNKQPDADKMSFIIQPLFQKFSQYVFKHHPIIL